MPTQYQLMKKSAFARMRKMEIKDFSEEELWRTFKHCREYQNYIAIVKSEIEDGLTIESLYEDQEQDYCYER